MTTTEAVTEHFVNTVAAEMAAGIDSAVECWMAEVDTVLHDLRLTTLGRVNAVRDIVEKYKQLSGKQQLANHQA
jgi:hypothetical protein